MNPTRQCSGAARVQEQGSDGERFTGGEFEVFNEQNGDRQDGERLNRQSARDALLSLADPLDLKMRQNIVEPLRWYM
ncbi:MAG TPA: hypothetical protein VJ840_02340 [Gemmatimonadaceae bacterium]|nr:hypothetical protein [Gemmatimonadaceae bacterium]